MKTSSNFQSGTRVFLVIFCFCLVYSVLIILSPLLLIILLYRSILSVTLRTLHPKIRLVGSSDAVFGIDSPGSVYTLTMAALVLGTPNIQAYRDKAKQKMCHRDENGHRPYWKLLCAVVPKWGYLWLEDKSDTLDWSHHVRYFPEEEKDSTRIYTEAEAYSNLASIADLEWEVSQPRWDVLVTPRVRSSVSGEIGHLISIRIHHLYGDGISAVQIFRYLAADEILEVLFDPVNPSMPKIHMGLWVLLYLQIFLMGPYILLRGRFFKEAEPFKMGPLKGPKYLGKLKMDIPIDSIRQIRAHYGCTTQAIWHSIFTGAMASTATKKGFQVPPKIIGGINFARFPYPDEYPHNRVIFGLEPVRMIPDRIERLAVMTHKMKDLARKPYTLMTSAVLIKLFGMLPTHLARVLTGDHVCNYLLSNVPGVKGYGRSFGNLGETTVGFAPLTNGMQFSVAVASYNGKFNIGIGAEHSALISSQQEFDEFLRDVENELKFLMLNME